MRLCRFDESRIGIVRNGRVYDVTAVLGRLPPHRYPLPRHDVLIASLEQLKPRLEAEADRSAGRPVDEVTLFAPVANPGKLIAAPVNYVRHLDEVRLDSAIHHQNQIDEIHKVGLFLKATSSLIGQERPVSIRFDDRRNDHEIELVAVIGKTADRVAESDALDHVAGYSIGLDMTVRGPEERSMRKSLDTFSVLGPVLVTADEFGDPSEAGLELTVNGETRQKANTRDLVLSVPRLIALASSYYTLHPGDLIYTGTPEGVGAVRRGDVIAASIDRIGTLHARIS